MCNLTGGEAWKLLADRYMADIQVSAGAGKTGGHCHSGDCA